MLKLNQFLVKEHVGLLRIANAYDILDPTTGSQVGIAREIVPGWVMALGILVDRQLLPTTIEIVEKASADAPEKILVSIKRGFTFLRAKIRVIAHDGTDIGYFKSKLMSFSGGFWLFDPRDQKFAEVKGDWKGWNFKLVSTTGSEMGSITKQWAGIGKEFFTSADNYIIIIDDKLSASDEAKTLLLAAGIALDTIYKER